MTLFKLSSLTMLLAVTITSLQVNADVKAKEATNKVATLAEAETTVSGRETSNLRCWQYGQLLFEETHLSNKDLSPESNALIFEGAGDSKDREVVLISTGSATCLYKKI